MTLLFLAPVTVAAPYTPSSDDTLIATLPPGTPSGLQSPSLAQRPQVAVAVARAYIQRARHSADPRFLGYAEGVLQPWWRSANPPPQILLLRATLLQARHDFEPALADLDRLLSREPDNVQGWLTRATILRVQGRFDDARRACDRLNGRVAPTVATLCDASVDSLTGNLPAAIARLDALQPRLAAQPDDIRAWWLAERAGMATRAGDDNAADRYFQQAVDQKIADPLLRAAFADWLIATGRPQRALTVTGNHPRAEVLRLRTAMARRALGSPDPVLVAELADAFAVSRRRGEDIHLREQAMFELWVRNRPADALALALENWHKQREPADLRVLLAAATAAGRPAAAQPARDWIARWHLEDARLAAPQTPDTPVALK